MAEKIFQMKVTSVNMNTLRATLVHPEEIDDVANCVVFLPSFFGGKTNPYPCVGEVLNVRYANSRLHQPIQEVWR